MTRQEFREAVFTRDSHCCVVCHAPAVDAHHLLERRLWPDGGYHVDNGVSLCGPDHLRAESTALTPRELRLSAGITKILVPPHMETDEEYDKWGNIYLADGRRAPGELFYDESVQKVIAPYLHEFTRYSKYPRTLHLPWSEGQTEDDRTLTVIPFIGQDIVITEKLDGENTTMYRDHIHARSIDFKGHPSRSWVKNLHAKIAYDIPLGWRACGENLQAQHAIAYDKLPGYFVVFSIWDEHNVCLSWDDTLEWAALLDLPTVPVLWEGKWQPNWNADEMQDRIPTRTSYSPEREGYVIRMRHSFSYRDFRYSMGKYVRADHVNEGTQHWFTRNIIPNTLA